MSAFPEIWVFDRNFRVYPAAEKGHLWSSSGPIYREHWRQREVTGETRASWLTSYGEKIPKKGGRGIAFSLAEVEEDVWVNDNRHRLARRVEECDAATLRKIAAILDSPKPGA